MSTTKTIGRDLPNGTYVEITAKLEGYWALTVLGWDQSGTWDGRACKRNGRDANFAGPWDDIVKSVAPEVEPIQAIHLAEPDGTPMHALANGWYFYSGKAAAYERKHYSEEYAARFGTDHERAARALHIDPADLPEDLDEADFRALVDALAEKWASQAAAARAALDAMVDGDGVEDLLERHR